MKWTISAFAFVADVAINTQPYVSRITSRQTHARCDWQDLTDLRSTEWQDGKKHFEALACLLPHVVAGGGGGGKGLDAMLHLRLF